MGDWRTKFAALLADAFGRTTPIKVEPKHTPRTSGPKTVPSDWMDPDRQRFIGPQCDGCHQNQPYGVTLRAGYCGPCWVARMEQGRVVNDDLPPAA